jgi:ribose transport system ATP-binding protein
VEDSGLIEENFMETKPLLRMANISKQFPGVQALDDVDFEVYPGEILGFVGENGAGKSTLIKILSGVYSRDQGSIWLDDQPIEPSSPQHAQKLGISTIYQELALIPHLSVSENIFLNREPRLLPAIGMVNFRKMRRDSERILQSLGTEVLSHLPVKDLTVAAQQMVEIAKAVSQNARIILMDEPTSALSSREVDALFGMMRRLKEQGVPVVFISHRLEEIMQVVDRIIVMRDGRRVGTLPIAEASEEKIIQLMVGRKVGLFPKLETKIGEPVLEVRHLSSKSGVRDVSFTVHKGEIVGLAGLVGAGRTEVARAICGIDRLTGGEVLIDGEPVRINTPAHAVQHGIGWIPEDRKTHGLLLTMTVAQNITMAILSRISNALAKISNKEEKDIATRYVDMLDIATPGINQVVNNLSGGNQQKVVLAKWLSTYPKLLIMDEPTRGIDVGAKAEVHALMSQLAQQGLAILMISSEMPEIMGMSDRVIVLCQGRVTGEFKRDSMSQEEIMTSATKFVTVDAIADAIAAG